MSCRWATNPSVCNPPVLSPTRLPHGITVMTRARLTSFKHTSFRQQGFGQLRLATSRRDDDHRTTGSSYHDPSPTTVALHIIFYTFKRVSLARGLLCQTTARDPIRTWTSLPQSYRPIGVCDGLKPHHASPTTDHIGYRIACDPTLL